MPDTVTIQKTEYEHLQEIEHRYEIIQKLVTSEEAIVDSIIAKGEMELQNGKTIVASSSEEALKKYYAETAARS